jgi:hypothetical protein
MVHGLATPRILGFHNRDQWHLGIIGFLKQYYLIGNLIFIGVFNFQWQSPTSKQAFFHSLAPCCIFSCICRILVASCTYIILSLYSNNMLYLYYTLVVLQ